MASDFEVVRRRQAAALRSIEELYAVDFWRLVMGTRMSMVDGLGGVNARQRALGAKRLKNLALHCRRRGYLVSHVDWGKWAAGPQLLSGEVGVVEKV